MTISNVYLIFWGPFKFGGLCGRTARTCLDTGLRLGEEGEGGVEVDEGRGGARRRQLGEAPVFLLGQEPGGRAGAPRPPRSPPRRSCRRRHTRRRRHGRRRRSPVGSGEAPCGGGRCRGIVDLAPGRGDGEPGEAAEGLPGGGDDFHERVAGEPVALVHFRTLFDWKEPGRPERRQIGG